MVKRARAASAELSISKRSGAVTRKLAIILTAYAEYDGAGQGLREAAQSEEEEVQAFSEMLEPKETAE
jgi:hypothetical protein